MPAVKDDQKKTTQEKRPKHDVRILKEIILGYVVKHESHDGRWDEGGGHRRPRLRLPQQRFAVKNDHRKNGAQLDGDLKTFQKFALGKTEQTGRQDKMPRGGNGKEFRNPFYNAENNCFEYAHNTLFR